MQLRIPGHHQWQKTLCKIVTHPTFRVVAAIIVMALSAWIVVQTQMDLQHDRDASIPLLFGQK